MAFEGAPEQPNHDGVHGRARFDGLVIERVADIIG
jgi:hypothetical protein